MRFRTAGELPRLDLAPVVDLIPAFRDEWAGLEFDRAGHLVNPLTGATVAALTLLEGRHRQPGAIYRVDASPDLTLVARLRDDNARVLAVAVSDESAHWSIDIDVGHERWLPTVELRGRVDLTASLKAARTPGCLAGVFGGVGEGNLVVELGTLQRGGPIATGAARANRFRVDGRVDVRTSVALWGISAQGSLRARGLARPVLWFTRRRIRRSIDESLAAFWASSTSETANLERELAKLRTAVEEEGGAVPYVRRVLWDDTFGVRQPWRGDESTDPAS